MVIVGFKYKFTNLHNVLQVTQGIAYKRTMHRVKIKSFPDSNHNNHQDSITCQLLPVLQIFRIVGRCPLSFSKWDAGVEKREITFVSYDKGSFTLRLISFIVAVWFNLFPFVSFVGLAFPEIQKSYRIIVDLRTTLTIREYAKSQVHPPGMSRFAFGVSDVVVQIIMVWIIAEQLIAWWNTSSLAKFLNNWNTLEINLQSVGVLHSSHNYGESRLVRFRNRSFLLTTLISVAFGISYLSSGLISGVDRRIERDAFAKVCFVLRTSYAVMLPVLMQIQDNLNICLFKSCTLAFERIKNFLERDYGTNEVRYAKVVSQLYDLLHDIRKHCSELGEHVASHLLPSLVCNLCVSAAGVFVAAKVMFQYDGSTAFRVVSAPMVYTVWSLVRLGYIINVASEVTSMEGRLAEALYQSERKETNEHRKAELRRTYEFLTLHPTKISLNGYVTLDKGLFTAMLGQLLTLVIILLQFDG